MIFHLRSYSKVGAFPPSTIALHPPLLPAAVAAAGKPKKIFDFGMPEVHCFQPSSRYRAKSSQCALPPDSMSKSIPSNEALPSGRTPEVFPPRKLSQ
ncbi:hypothetical protein OSB04_021026, partial [Centaurea solstitialis]